MDNQINFREVCVCVWAIFIFLIACFIQKRKKRKEKKETSQNEYLDLKLKLNRFTSPFSCKILLPRNKKFYSLLFFYFYNLPGFLQKSGKYY